MTDCIFCKIISKTIPADIVFENDNMLAFKDIHPQYPVHLLLIPKIHIKSLEEVSAQNANLIQEMLLTLPKIAKENGLLEGFRTVLNTGAGGGQEVDHIHFHLIGDVRHKIK
ncbi:MAG: histidine triad nucleotide-binding protein [Saccharospirillaceae bacterium]|nr:histidine triad nucleotide-binding protein [Pseudomonadales bacterium]NRB79377.1 histidine triad nucleotide-binding protein [Saccharospirillaceae bacterium]